MYLYLYWFLFWDCILLSNRVHVQTTWMRLWTCNSSWLARAFMSKMMRLSIFNWWLEGLLPVKNMLCVQVFIFFECPKHIERLSLDIKMMIWRVRICKGEPWTPDQVWICLGAICNSSWFLAGTQVIIMRGERAEDLEQDCFETIDK